MDHFIDQFQRHLAMAGRPAMEWMMPDPDRFRFRLGDSRAKFKIPYSLDGKTDKLIEGFIADLIGLCHRNLKRAGDPIAPGCNLLTSVYAADPLRTDGLAALKRYVPEVHVGPLAAWYWKDARAKLWARAVHALYEKAVKDEVNRGFAEDLTYLTHLALLQAHLQKKRRLLQSMALGQSFERMDVAVGFALYCLFRPLGLAMLGSLVHLANHPAYRILCNRVALTVAPGVFIGIRSAMLRRLPNPCGLTRPLAEAMDALHVRHVVTNESLEEQRAILTDRVIQEPSLWRTLDREDGLYRVRRAIHRLLRSVKEYERPIFKQLTAAYADGEMPLAAWAAQAGEWAMQLTQERERYAGDAEFAAALAPLLAELDHLGGYDLELGGPAGTPESIRAAAADLVVRYLVWRSEEALMPPFEKALGFLEDRMVSLEQRVTDLIGEYRSGRLYRLAPDNQPVLHELVQEKTGQMFVDMKGYTQRTYESKEVVMADFMRNEFYKPILQAAKEYHSVAEEGNEGGSIEINNLLGDAVSLSGPVEDLLELARDIQGVFKDYRAKLEENANRRTAALNGGDSGPVLSIIGGEQTAGLDAGLFISYGARPELVQFNDELWGSIKVSIAEKINEAARGTARNPMLRGKLEQIVLEARRRTDNPRLIYPFRVFVDQNLSLNLPAELAARMQQVLLHRDIEGGKEAGRDLARLLYADFQKHWERGSGDLVGSSADIYNLGEAISAEALQAYLKATSLRRFHYIQRVHVRQLDSDFHERFVFPAPQLKFVVSLNPRRPDDVKLFVHSGALVFRGFERRTMPTGIYELLRNDSDFVSLLARHHLALWNEAAQKSPQPMLEL